MDGAVSGALRAHVPAIIARGQGALLEDVDGNVLIDLSGGIGCLAVGHSHPRVVQAISEQSARFTHTDFTVVPYEGYIRLAERLVRTVPGASPKKAAFFNSGAEAVENAVKVARAYTRRPALIAFEGGFHGRTYMALSLTSKIKPYKYHLGPFMPEVYRVPFPHASGGGLRTGTPTMEECTRRLDELFAMHVPADNVAAMVVEPVQGEGGIIVPPREFLPYLRRVCDAHGILLVVDEIQTGVGRTGKMWAVEHAGVEPDLLCAAKSIAAGMPLAAVIGRQEILDGIPESSIGGTFVGNPVCCAAALAVLDVIEEERLIERAGRIGKHLMTRLQAIQRESDCIGEIRGMGAMVGVEIVDHSIQERSAPEVTKRIIERAMAHGVILLRAGLNGNVIRILTSLVTTDGQLEEALDVIHRAVAEETTTTRE